MRIKNDPKISILANRLFIYRDIENVLKRNGIPCLTLDLEKIYQGDDKKAFRFGHDYYRRSVVCFYDDDYRYYAVGSSKKITKILKNEIAVIIEEDQF